MFVFVERGKDLKKLRTAVKEIKKVEVRLSLGWILETERLTRSEFR
jgi:hypothetical protein